MAGRGGRGRGRGTADEDDLVRERIHGEIRMQEQINSMQEQTQKLSWQMVWLRRRRQGVRPIDSHPEDSGNYQGPFCASRRGVDWPTDWRSWDHAEVDLPEDQGSPTTCIVQRVLVSRQQESEDRRRPDVFHTTHRYAPPPPSPSPHPQHISPSPPSSRVRYPSPPPPHVDPSLPPSCVDSPPHVNPSPPPPHVDPSLPPPVVHPPPPSPSPPPPHVDALPSPPPVHSPYILHQPPLVPPVIPLEVSNGKVPLLLDVETTLQLLVQAPIFISSEEEPEKIAKLEDAGSVCALIFALVRIGDSDCVEYKMSYEPKKDIPHAIIAMPAEPKPPDLNSMTSSFLPGENDAANDYRSY